MSLFFNLLKRKSLSPLELKMNVKAVYGTEMTTTKVMWVYELCIRKIKTQSIEKNKEKCNTKFNMHRV